MTSSMRFRSPLEAITPVPETFSPRSGGWQPGPVPQIGIPPELAELGEPARRIFSVLGIEARFSTAPDSGTVRLGLKPELGREGWRMDVSPDRVRIDGGDRAGVFYALGAFLQVLAVAASRGADVCEVACGTVVDHPRFVRRGLMLDCARHFQSKATVLRVLRAMAARRLNVFHWHLSDSQGWRLDLASVPASVSPDTLDRGFYSREDVAEIIAFARAHCIEIVPEIDVPGHAKALTGAFTHLACDPRTPGAELCIGKPETMAFLRTVWDEVLELFPESPFVHIGGDEASVRHWQACPHCQAAIRRLGLAGERELENHFMAELADFIRSRGRTPIVWSTESSFSAGTVVQVWRDMSDLPRHAKAGCQTVMSLHSRFYLDYPATPDEPAATWMAALPEAAVYAAEPFFMWEEESRDSLLGPEVCLWTETVPDWRVLAKIRSRLDAAAETAWSQPCRKDWHDFSARTSLLTGAGYEELLARLEC